MSVQTALLPVALGCMAAFLLAGCTTTPDETYKASQMTKALDYPPDLVAPTLSPRFSVPPAAAPVEDDSSDDD